jgi:heme-degrading monooxygenase HmoA
MPDLCPESGYLTVLNIFRTDSLDRQERLLGAMRKIVDAAAYEGWVSSTVHSGVDRFGTANLIQWRNREDLERRYASDEFRHQIPLFAELTTTTKLLQTDVAFTQHHPATGQRTEISPSRGYHTVIEIFGVSPENLDELVTALGKGQEWLLDTPGYRSHSVLRGKGLRGKWARPLDGCFAVTYSQWDAKRSFDAYRTTPRVQRSAERRALRARLDALVTAYDWNTYRVVHSRSAGQAERAALVPHPELHPLPRPPQ